MGSRRSHVLAQALLLGAYGLASLAHAQADKPIVAVFAIEGRDTRLPPRSLAALTEYLSTRLSSSGAFAVIPTDEVKRRLDEQKSASYKACYDQSCQIEIGKELAAQHSVSTQVARLGGRCVVSSKLFDLKRGTADRAAVSECDCSEAGMMTALQDISAQLSRTAAAPVTASAPPVTPPVAPAAPAPADPNLLTSWRQQERPDFEQHPDGIVGASGRLIWKERLVDFELEFDAEYVGGSTDGALGILWRGGGPEGETPQRGYSFGARWSGTYNIFSGVGGGWTSLATAWGRGHPYKPSPIISPRRNKVRLEVKGTSYTLHLNGQLLDRGDHSAHRGGYLGIGPFDGAIVKFSNIRLTPR